MIPGTFTFDGIVREYVLRVPPGWQQALTEALAAGRLGLPLLVAFHGGRIGFDRHSPLGDRADPEQFQRDWDFPSVWAQPPGPGPVPDRDCRDQCFVLYPYAVGAMDHFNDYDHAAYFTPRDIWAFFKAHPRARL